MILRIWKLLYFFHGFITMCIVVLATSSLVFYRFKSNGDMALSTKEATNNGIALGALLWLMWKLTSWATSKLDPHSHKLVRFNVNRAHFCTFLFTLILFLTTVIIYGKLQTDCADEGEPCNLYELILNPNSNVTSSNHTRTSSGFFDFLHRDDNDV